MSHDQATRIKKAIPALLSWYRKSARPLPWRQSPTPYRVWVSEIMLQQTRIEAVIPYFERFMEALPSVDALASVEDDRLLKLWEGLGYYSRARNLKKAAQSIVAQYGGEPPADFDALRSLSGLGDYTAGAVASIAFGIPVPAVDGNVLRVVARLMNDDSDVMVTATKRRFTDIVRAWIPADAAGDFNSALMELGERVCLPHTAPRCAECPLNDVCAANAAGTAAVLPTRIKKTKRRVERRMVFLIISNEDAPRVLLRRRADSGLLAGLWELPNVEGEYSPEAAAAALADYGVEPTALRHAGEGKHLFSHVEWQMVGVQANVPPFAPPPAHVWADLRELNEQYALPTAFRPFARLLPILLQKEAL